MFYPVNVKQEPNDDDDDDYGTDTNDLDNNEIKNIPFVKLESKDPDWNYDGKLKSKEKSVSFNLDCQSHSESNLAESGNIIETDVADAQHPTTDDRGDDIEPETTTTDPQIENSHE